jgi:hypothetical protein
MDVKITNAQTSGCDEKMLKICFVSDVHRKSPILAADTSSPSSYLLPWLLEAVVS